MLGTMKFSYLNNSFLITNKEFIRYKYLLVIRGLLRNLCLPRTFFFLFLSIASYDYLEPCVAQNMCLSKT